MITWDYFVKVRRLKVREWLENRGVKTYDDFLKRLKDLGVEPVSETVFNTLVSHPSDTAISSQPSPADDILSPELDVTVSPESSEEMTGQVEIDVVTPKKKTRKMT